MQPFFDRRPHLVLFAETLFSPLPDSVHFFNIVCILYHICSLYESDRSHIFRNPGYDCGHTRCLAQAALYFSSGSATKFKSCRFIRKSKFDIILGRI